MSEEFRVRVEELQKHMIGRHNQQSHARSQHMGGEKAKQGFKVGAALGGVMGVGTGLMSGQGLPASLASGGLQALSTGATVGTTMGQAYGTRLYGNKGGKVSGVGNAVADPLGTFVRRRAGTTEEEKKGLKMKPLKKREEVIKISKKLRELGYTADDLR
jgi:hypothetical protein